MLKVASWCVIYWTKVNTPYLLLWELYGLMAQYVSAQPDSRQVFLYNFKGCVTCKQRILPLTYLPFIRR
jgi:hypothetical protein